MPSIEIAKLIDTTTRLTEEVALQKERLTGAADIATAKASEASVFAEKATGEAAKAVQISGLATVDAALAAREGEFVGNAVANTTGSRMKQVLDANGNYNTMVSIPCFTFDDVGMAELLGVGVHPAFLRQDSSIIPEIWIGAYTASNKSNNAVVQGGADPWNTVDYDEAKAKCSAMGAGWHMMTAMEWSAVSIWCLANGFLPSGNTEFGRNHGKKHETCRRVDGRLPNDRAGTPRGLCGSGPSSWRHDGTPFGISDLVGSVWEWIDGFKLVEGQIHTATYNEQDESQWEAQPAFLDTGNRLHSQKTASTNTSVAWAELLASEAYASNNTLKKMLIEPIAATSKLSGRLYYNNDGTRLPLRGGDWVSGSNCGLAALNLANERSSRYSNVGFRPAFIAA